MNVSHHLLMLLFIAAALPAAAQPYGQPDRASPGDEMIQSYLRTEALKLDARFNEDFASPEKWIANRPQYQEEFFDMLGLSPRPERTPLHATVTHTLKKDDYEVDCLHYQSIPHLYVTANLYRPAKTNPNEKLPAILYVCGHSGRGRDGNKVAYESHGIWFARHGYLCLVLDTLQLGEIAAKHHGTYNLGRWSWHSRGYTPAGVECWNGVRGIDYLVSRPDVDPDKIAVTGISGGGAATYWVTAADPRVKVAVPVSGMADLESYVGNRVINGHCDCMFLYNHHQWPWTRIAALIAPRPMLFTNSDQDAIFPMDANQRIINRLERLYSLYGAADQVDAFVSIGGHAYRQDIRQAAYRFINTHLKNDPRPITDSEIDIVSEGAKPGPYPIPPETLRVFPTDNDIPKDELNTTVDEHFVPVAKLDPPARGQYENWRRDLLKRLHQSSFHYLPETILHAKKLGDADPTAERWQSEEGIEFRLRFPAPLPPDGTKSVLLVILNEDEANTTPEWLKTVSTPDQTIILCEPRGVGQTRWTKKNPPNFVERAHALLGRTVDTGRVWDTLAAAKTLATHPRLTGRADIAKPLPIHLAGQKSAGIIAAYAAALDDQAIASVTLLSPPTTHTDNAAPQFLSILRTGDIPDLLGLVAPRPLTIMNSDPAAFARTKSIYTSSGAPDAFRFR